MLFRSRHSNFTGPFGAREIHVSGVLGGCGKAHVKGVDFVVVLGENYFGTIEGDVFGDGFFGCVCHRTFYLQLRHGPIEQLVYRMGVGWKSLGFRANNPMVVYFFKC